MDSDPTDFPSSNKDEGLEMSLTEEKRINLANSAREVLGVENGNTLMEHLPPVGWADVATKEDVLHSTIVTQHDIAALAAETNHQFTLVRKEIGQLEYQLLARLEIQSQTLTAEMYKAINRSTLIYVVSLLTAMFINRI